MSSVRCTIQNEIFFDSFFISSSCGLPAMRIGRFWAPTIRRCLPGFRGADVTEGVLAEPETMKKRKTVRLSKTVPVGVCG